MTQDRRQPWVIAHRGVPYEVPENTLAGFERAIQQGADWIELDVHQTADGQLVVIHDETVDRTTNGSGLVARKTLDELQALNAGSWMNDSFASERIPTLADVLALTKDRAGVVIEVKAGTRRYPGIELRLIELLQLNRRLEDIIIISADRDAITALRRFGNGIATLCFHERLLVPETWPMPSERNTDRFSYTKFLFGDVLDITGEVVRQAHRKRIGVLSSLVTEREVSAETISCLAQAGVDGIFTNEPAELRKRLSS